MAEGLRDSGICNSDETAISISDAINGLSVGGDVDVRTYSPLTLAYLGDAVYEIVVRTALVKKGNCPVNRLNQMASSLVKASAQSAVAASIEPLLSDEEASVYRRGRNAHSYTMAKNASMSDYRRATGVEALVGYLYLQGKTDRILELLKAGLILKKD
ncbi:MAG: ribonuclease III [Blautia sp.]|nr:ribonuclease III [Blautia sp.]